MSYKTTTILILSLAGLFIFALLLFIVIRTLEATAKYNHCSKLCDTTNVITCNDDIEDPITGKTIIIATCVDITSETHVRLVVSSNDLNQLKN